jgi:hypothetical protein
MSGDRIVAVGSVADCTAAIPERRASTPTAALLPGFTEPQGNPLISGVATQPPARSIAAWDAPDMARRGADAWYARRVTNSHARRDHDRLAYGAWPINSRQSKIQILHDHSLRRSSFGVRDCPLCTAIT